MIEPPTATRVSLYVTIVAPIASNLGPVISMFDNNIKNNFDTENFLHCDINVGTYLPLI